MRLHCNCFHGLVNLLTMIFAMSFHFWLSHMVNTTSFLTSVASCSNSYVLFKFCIDSFGLPWIPSDLTKSVMSIRHLLGTENSTLSISFFAIDLHKQTDKTGTSTQKKTILNDKCLLSDSPVVVSITNVFWTCWNVGIVLFVCFISDLISESIFWYQSLEVFHESFCQFNNNFVYRKLNQF